MHPIDEIEFHKKAVEMIYLAMTNKAMSVHKIQNSLGSIIAGFKLEMTSSQA